VGAPSAWVAGKAPTGLMAGAGWAAAVACATVTAGSSARGFTSDGGSARQAISAARPSPPFASTSICSLLRELACFSSSAQASGRVRDAASARAMRLRMSACRMALPYSPGTAKASSANAPSTPSSMPMGQCKNERPTPNTISASPSAAAT